MLACGVERINFFIANLLKFLKLEEKKKNFVQPSPKCSYLEEDSNGNKIFFYEFSILTNNIHRLWNVIVTTEDNMQFFFYVFSL